MSEEQVDTKEKQEERAAKTAQVLDMKFSFVVRYEESPKVQEIIDSVIAVFQTGSISLLNKEVLEGAEKKAGELESKELLFEGYMDAEKGQFLPRIAVVTDKKQIIKGTPLSNIKGLLPMMNRKQRRARR